MTSQITSISLVHAHVSSEHFDNLHPSGTSIPLNIFDWSIKWRPHLQKEATIIFYIFIHVGMKKKKKINTEEEEDPIKPVQNHHKRLFSEPVYPVRGSVT